MIAARPVLSVDPSHLGLSMTFPRLFDAPMEGSNALHSQGPAQDRTYSSAGRADVDGDSPAFAGRLQHGRAFDSDPARGWARLALYDFVWNWTWCPVAQAESAGNPTYDITD